MEVMYGEQVAPKGKSGRLAWSAGGLPTWMWQKPKVEISPAVEPTSSAPPGVIGRLARMPIETPPVQHSGPRDGGEYVDGESTHGTRCQRRRSRPEQGGTRRPLIDHRLCRAGMDVLVSLASAATIANHYGTCGGGRSHGVTRKSRILYVHRSNLGLQ